MTIFIIIGIVLLFIFAAILYITQVTVKDPLRAQAEPIIADVPQTFQPIQLYTQNCLANVAERGLRRAGEQGGYIYPELVGEYSATRPADADGLDIGSAKVPYWHYNNEPNTANTISLTSLQPPLRGSEALSMESQLRRYVTEKLDDCLHEYVVFSLQGFSVEQEEKDVAVTIGSDFVAVNLEMPLTARKGSEETEMERFYVKLPLALERYYTIADTIRKMQENYSFMERQALDLIEVYSAVDVKKLPPPSATSFELVPTTYWDVPGIEDKLQQMLTSYVPMLRFLGTDNFYATVYPVSNLAALYQRTYDNMVLPLDNAQGTEVRFDYLGWKPYVHVNDQNGVVQPSHYATHYWLLHFGMQDYNTLYDLSYPALVTIKDANAFGGEGYSFSFALEANVRNNKPAEHNDVFSSSAPVLLDTIDCTSTDTELLKTIVVDSFTKEPVQGVEIAFSIPNQVNCQMGITDAQGVVETTYPAVYGGVLTLLKEGYLTTFYPLDTYPLKDAPAIIGAAVSEGEEHFEAYPYKEMKVSVKKKMMGKCVGNDCFFSSLVPERGVEVFSVKPEFLDDRHHWQFTGAVREIDQFERALVTFTRVADLVPGVQGEEFVAVAEVKGNVFSIEQPVIQLVPGVYEISATLFTENPLIIPAQERCSDGIAEIISCFDTDGCCFTIEETRMDTFMEGQIAWTTPSTYLTITPEQVYGSSEMVIYIPAMDMGNVPPSSRVVEDLQLLGQFGNISTREGVYQALQPRFR